MIVTLLIVLIISILFTSFKRKVIENYPWHYRPMHYMPSNITRYYRMDYVPPIILPPTYADIGISEYSNSHPQMANSMYCKRNPLCYPCPRWKYIGPPYCR